MYFLFFTGRKRDPTSSGSFSPQILTYFQQEENWENFGEFFFVYAV
jgi:hypothetical protein